MTDDVHDVSSAEPGGADELADARAIEQSMRAEAAATGATVDADAAIDLGVAVDRQLEAILMIADEPQ